MEDNTVTLAAVEPVETVATVPTAEDFPMYGNYPDHVLTDETYLTSEIAQLWHIHSSYTGTIKSELRQQRAVGNSLGKLLYSMKSALVAPGGGRGGKWSAWLKQQKIPRASADRMVARYAEAFHLNGELPHEATKPEPTPAQFGKLVTVVAEKCEKLLPSHYWRFKFMCCLAYRLGLRYEHRLDGVMVYDPACPQPPEAEVAPAQDGVVADGEYGDIL